MFRSLFGVLILVFVVHVNLFSQSTDYSILKSDESKLILQFNPQFDDTSLTEIQGISYRNCRFSFRQSILPLQPGNPELFRRSVVIGLPDSLNNSIKILAYKSIFIPGKPTPVQIAKHLRGSEQFVPENSIYSSSQVYPVQIFELTKFGMVRGVIGGELSVFPVRFYPNENKIELITSITLEVSFPASKNNAVISRDGLIRSLLVNGDVAQNWQKESPVTGKLQNIVEAPFATGKWYRFEAPEEGMYKITRDMLPSFGIDPNTVDPRKIKIFSQGGEVLSETVAFEKTKNLKEIAIYIQGQENGVFDASDYILFYGRGVNFFRYDTNSSTVRRNRNPYSFKNYYYITLSSEDGKRMNVKQSTIAAASVTQTNTTAYLFKEEDKINLANTGLEFWGQEINARVNSFTDKIVLPGYIPNSSIFYSYSFVSVNRSGVYNRLDVSSNSVIRSSKYLPSLSNSYPYIYGDEFWDSFSDVLSTGNTTELNFFLKTNGPTDLGYLGYYDISYTADLSAVSDFKIFYNKYYNTNIEYKLGGFSNSSNLVFDISRHSDVQLLDNVQLNGSEVAFRVNEGKYMSSKYLAVNSGKFKFPINIEQVANQNLRGNTAGAEYVIITAKPFLEQAERLRKFRAESAAEKLTGTVVDIDQIITDFGYGTKDPSGLRDFLTYAYNTWTVKPLYVLLFGDGDYDFRNIEGYNNNFIPTHQIWESLDLVSSSSYDDFFACINGIDRISDIAVGRLSVQTAEQARIVVDKIIAYEQNKDKSSWRNLITLVADDDLKPTAWEGWTHVNSSESLSRKIPGSFNINKVYGNFYPEVSTSYGRRRPAAVKALIGAINNGTVLLNYYGHGSAEVLADEQMFTNSGSIPALYNTNYFFLTAATCEFGYYDRTIGMSGAELLVVKENAGAIGSFAANRPVLAQQNEDIDEFFYDQMFTPDLTKENPARSIGVAFMKTKQTFNNANDMAFHLFADPALKLAYPISGGSIDSINGKSLKQIYQLKGLSKSVITGKIYDNNGNVNTSFNGEAILSVFDSKQSMLIGDYQYKQNIEMPGGLLYRGKVKIENGLYRTSFVVPKDISSENQLGKITLYFFNDKIGGTAATSNIKVGGFDTTSNDLKGPQISVSFDKNLSGSSYVVSPDAKLYVRLVDETAINTANTGIGHELSAVLNGDESNRINLSNYYTADASTNGATGLVEYPFNGLAEGEYSIKVYAYDVFNNLDSAQTIFKVVSETDPQLVSVINYPNPFSATTSFIIDHNFSGAVDISIKIYSVAGRLLQNLETMVTNQTHVVLPWNGQDKESAPLANGVYLYKVKLSPRDGGKVRSMVGKLAITR